MLSYEKFKELGGNEGISQAYFKAAYIEAKNLINYYTFNRIKKDNEEIINKFNETVVLLINYSFEESLASSNLRQKASLGIKSESVGKHSVSYGTSEDELKAYNKRVDEEKYNIIKSIWAHTGLMYRGGGYIDNKLRYNNI